MKDTLAPDAASAASVANDSVASIRVWDLPTRLFHWLLAAAVIGAVVTAKIGGNAMVWHMRLGLLVMALLLFRVLWGLVGGIWSRFARFVPLPSSLRRYLKGQSAAHDYHHVGHSPLGALSVLAMLAILAVQVGTGLVADDEIATQGPLNRFVETASGLLATSWHKTWGQWLIYFLVGMHIAAIVFYRVVQKNDLVTPMFRGDKRLPPGTPASRDDGPSRLLALVLVLGCAAVSLLVMRAGQP